jgi:DNA sulfur modification protein DndD
MRQQKCICGTQLIPQTNSYLQIQTWLARASIAVMEETTLRLLAQIDELEQHQPQFWTTLDRQQQIVASHRQKISEIESQLDTLEDRLRRNTDREIRASQQHLDQIELETRDLTLEQGANYQQITHLEGQIGALSKQIQRQKANHDKQALAQRRLQAAQDAIDVLNHLRQEQEQQFRQQLEQRVQEIFQEISFTPYLPKITDKYELILVEHHGGQETIVAASTGENQILSLSFIGGIIDRVREWSQRKLLTVPESNTFPIVMDSPFGSLDQISRRHIAQILPQLANQLLILVSKTQWRGEVETEIEQHIGHQYVLTYYSSKPDCIEDAIEITDIHYPLIKRSPNEFDYTEITLISKPNHS